MRGGGGRNEGSGVSPAHGESVSDVVVGCLAEPAAFMWAHPPPFCRERCDILPTFFKLAVRFIFVYGERASSSNNHWMSKGKLHAEERERRTLYTFGEPKQEGSSLYDFRRTLKEKGSNAGFWIGKATSCSWLLFSFQGKNTYGIISPCRTLPCALLFL